MKLDRTSDMIPIPIVQKKEKEVCADLRKFWKDNDFFYIRNQQGIGSTKGLADYTVVRNGLVVFVEAKATKGKQSPYQKDFQLKLENAGGEYRLVHSLEEFIEGWGRGRTGER